MFLSTHSAAALWNLVVKNEITNGAFKEGLKPADHWRFWKGIGAECAGVDRVDVFTDGLFECWKNRYSLEKLAKLKSKETGKYTHRDLMLRIGRLAKAGMQCDLISPVTAACMPVTLEEFKAGAEAGGWDQRTIGALKGVDAVLAERYYRASYEPHDLITDLERIKSAMRTAKIYRP